MKTNEFIKKVEAMGYRVERYENELLIKDFHGIEHACAAEYKIYKINTSYAGFDSIPNTEQEQLFKLLTEYAITPIEEREEEKKYMYRIKKVEGLNYSSMDYLNYNELLKTCFLDDSSDGIFKTEFTHSWLEEQGIDIEQLKEIYEELEVKE